MASRSRITRYDEYVAEKKERILKLKDLYEEVRELDVVASDSEAEEKILNAQYLKLLAEKKFLEEDKCEILPNDPDFLFEYAKYKLKMNIDNLEKSLEKETETKNKLLAEEMELVSTLAEKKLSNPNYDPAEELLEKEKDLNEVVKQLHQKLVEHLRNLARFHLSSDSPSNSTMNQKSFYELLQKFIVDLQESPPTDLSKDEFITYDESMAVEHLQFLFDSDVIEIVNQDPLAFRLKPFV